MFLRRKGDHVGCFETIKYGTSRNSVWIVESVIASGVENRVRVDLAEAS